jgi:hypothetical protein
MGNFVIETDIGAAETDDLPKSRAGRDQDGDSPSHVIVFLVAGGADPLKLVAAEREPPRRILAFPRDGKPLEGISTRQIKFPPPNVEH